MNKSKNILSIGLLIFVAAAVATTVARQSGSESAKKAESGKQAIDVSVPVDGVVVTFYHGEGRCPTCRKIETYARQAIDEGFAEELRMGKVRWETANYDDDANKEAARRPCSAQHDLESTKGCAHCA